MRKVHHMTATVPPQVPDEITKPADPTHLYRLWYRCSDGCQDPGDPYGRSPDHRCHSVIPYRITKVTEKRIYFRDHYSRSYFIARAAFDDEGHAFHRGLRERLHLTPPEIPGSNWTARTLSVLRREMADAHPDRGGDRDTFMAARRRYVAARGGAA